MPFFKMLSCVIRNNDAPLLFTLRGETVFVALNNNVAY
jgi:hypothetical protein